MTAISDALCEENGLKGSNFIEALRHIIVRGVFGNVRVSILGLGVREGDRSETRGGRRNPFAFGAVLAGRKIADTAGGVLALVCESWIG